MKSNWGKTIQFTIYISLFAFSYFTYNESASINISDEPFPYFTANSTEVKPSDASDIQTDFSPYMDIKKIALTFDDGPNSLTTPALLDGLKERNVKATFFIIGKSAAINPEIIKQMHEDGHLIGNHTNTHCELTSMSCEIAMENINLANETVYNITGENMDFIRPPFGECGTKLSNKLNMFQVLWDIDPRDWSIQNTKSVVNYVVNHVKDGDIILLHDIFDTSVDAALQIIDILTEEGYQFVTVEEIMFP